MTSQPPSSPVASAAAQQSGEIWPKRWHYLALAALCLFVVIYGSLVPLKYTPVSWSEAVAQFAKLFRPPFPRCSWTDAAANFLLMVPVNYCLLAALVGGRSAFWKSLAWSPMVLVASGAVSFGIEFLQMWFRERTPSVFDIVAQMVGGVVGLAAWIALGPTVARCLQSLRFDRRPANFVDWTLRFYLVGMFAWAFWPLNMTLSPAQWYHKYKRGLVVLKPFQDAPSTLQAIVDGVTTFVVFIPVGMWAASVWTSAKRPIRSLWASLLLGAIIAGLVTTIDLIVVSHTATTATLLLGLPGVLVGVLIMRRWRGGGEQHELPGESGSRVAYLWLIAAACYALLLVAWFCPPQQLMTDSDAVRSRFFGFFRLPLESLYRGTFLNAIKEVLRKSLLFAPLGGMLAMAALRWPIPTKARTAVWLLIILAAGLLATAIELLQIVMPPHIPDSTDVVLCTAGAALGVLIAIRIHEHGSRRDP